MQNLTASLSKKYQQSLQDGQFVDVTRDALQAGLQTVTLFAKQLYEKLITQDIDIDRVFSLVIVAVMQSDGNTYSIDCSSPFDDDSRLFCHLACDDNSTPVLTVSLTD